MSEKPEFHGGVGQAVLGNVNEAPRLSNIVKLSIGGQGEQSKPITNLQRQSIATKVKELVALGDIEQLDVYRVILTEFGAETIAELPRDRYKDAMALLDSWIAELRVESAPQEAEGAATGDALALQTQPAPCSTCEHHAKQTRSARLMMAVQTVVMLAITGIFSWLLWQTPAAANPITDSNCHVEGKAYSIGSVVKMANVLRECVQDAGNGSPYWGEMKKPRGR